MKTTDRCLIRILVFFCFLFVTPVCSWGQDIPSFPFNESFDIIGYKTYVSPNCQSNGGTLQHITGSSCYGGTGGCLKLTPPTSNGGCTMGIGGYSLPANTKQLNIRVMIKIGNQYEETARPHPITPSGVQNKMFIVGRSGASQRGMSIFEKRYMESWYTWGACEDNTCTYKNPSNFYYPGHNDTFKSNQYSDQWVCVEIEMNLNTQTSKTYIWTADGVNNGLHVTYSPYPEARGVGYYANIQIIGGYFNGYHVSDPNAYLMFDELKIDNKFIGPPPGFLNSRRSPPIGVSTQ